MNQVAAEVFTQDEINGAILKIRKLNRLADPNRNSTEGERENALEAIAELVAKYNLAAQQIENFAGDDGEAPSVGQNVSDVVGNGKPWVWGVAHAVKDLFYTEMYNNDGKVTFIGTPANIRASISMLQWLVESIEAEAKIAYPGGENCRLHRSSFGRGAAQQLQVRANQILKAEQQAEADRQALIAQENAARESEMGTEITEIQELIEMAKEEGDEEFAEELEQQLRAVKPEEQPRTPGTSLVLMRDTLQKNNKEFMDKLKLRKGRSSRSRISHDAYSRGKSFGAGINLSNQIGGGNNKRIGG